MAGTGTGGGGGGAGLWRTVDDALAGAGQQEGQGDGELYRVEPDGTIRIPAAAKQPPGYLHATAVATATPAATQAAAPSATPASAPAATGVVTSHMKGCKGAKAGGVGPDCGAGAGGRAEALITRSLDAAPDAAAGSGDDVPAVARAPFNCGDSPIADPMTSYVSTPHPSTNAAAQQQQPEDTRATHSLQALSPGPSTLGPGSLTLSPGTHALGLPLRPVALELLSATAARHRTRAVHCGFEVCRAVSGCRLYCICVWNAFLDTVAVCV